MTIVKRKIDVASKYAIDDKLYIASPGNEVLRDVNMTDMTGVLAQLSALVVYSTEMFKELYDIARKTNNGITRLSEKVEKISNDMHSNSQNKMLSIQDRSICYKIKVNRIPAGQSTVNQEQRFKKNTRCKIVQDLYNECEKMPNIQSFEAFNTSSTAKCVNEFSNPDFFFEEWAREEDKRQAAEMKRKEENKTKRRKKNKKKDGNNQEIAVVKKRFSITAMTDNLMIKHQQAISSKRRGSRVEIDRVHVTGGRRDTTSSRMRVSVSNRRVPPPTVDTDAARPAVPQYRPATTPPASINRISSTKSVGRARKIPSSSNMTSPPADRRPAMPERRASSRASVRRPVPQPGAGPTSGEKPQLPRRRTVGRAASQRSDSVNASKPNPTLPPRRRQTSGVPTTSPSTQQAAPTRTVPPIPVRQSISPVTSPVQAPAASISTTDRPEFEQFRKMKKMGLPIGAIRQAMQTKGFNPDELFPAETDTAPIAQAGTAVAALQTHTAPPHIPRKTETTLPKQTPSASPAAASASGNDAAAILAGDAKYAKYSKMQKMGLPTDAIKHAMTKDGFDPAAVFGAEVAAPSVPYQRKTQPKPKPAAGGGGGGMNAMLAAIQNRPALKKVEHAEEAPKEAEPDSHSEMLAALRGGASRLRKVETRKQPSTPKTDSHHLGGTGVAAILARRIAIAGVGDNSDASESDTGSSDDSEWDD